MTLLETVKKTIAGLVIAAAIAAPIIINQPSAEAVSGWSTYVPLARPTTSRPRRLPTWTSATPTASEFASRRAPVSR